MAITTLVSRQRLVAAKLETTQGTAISHAAADATTPFYDPKLSYDIPFNKRPSPGSASQFTGVPGPRKGTLTGQTHLYNSGTVTSPIWMTTLMAACGMSITPASRRPSPARRRPAHHGRAVSGRPAQDDRRRRRQLRHQGHGGQPLHDRLDVHREVRRADDHRAPHADLRHGCPAAVRQRDAHAGRHVAPTR
jgi:hypothetical protein